jgi:hypothetical protein
MPEPTAIDPETGYIGLCHFSPEAVRLLRAALDNGVDPAVLRETIVTIPPMFSGVYRTGYTLAALDYMVRNPRAGCVRWLDGGGYQFVELVIDDHLGGHPDV